MLRRGGGSVGIDPPTARRLALRHATLLYRITGHEDAAGVSGVDLRARGHAVPGSMISSVAAARKVRRAVQAVRRALRGTVAPLSGEVRVTSTDSFCQCLLATIVGRLRRVSPKRQVELIGVKADLDLGRIHSDITVRPAPVLPEDLVGALAATLGFGLFRRKGNERRSGLVCRVRQV
ncbi:MAG: hypothetical protein ACK4NE_10215, partial [Albidovulum sp.]